MTCKSEHVRKLRGLYVDYVDGQIVTPGDVTATGAETLIGDVQAVLDFQMRAWGDDEAPERILQRLDEDFGGDLMQTYAQFRAAIESDTDETVTRLRDVIHAHMRGELGEANRTGSAEAKYGQQHDGECSREHSQARPGQPTDEAEAAPDES